MLGSLDYYELMDVSQMVTINNSGDITVIFNILLKV